MSFHVQWEYYTEGVPMESLDQVLNMMGKDGWSLVYAQPGKLAPQSKVVSREKPGSIPALLVVMKRPKITTGVGVDYALGEDASQSVTVGLGIDNPN